MIDSSNHTFDTSPSDFIKATFFTSCSTLTLEIEKKMMIERKSERPKKSQK